VDSLVLQTAIGLVFIFATFAAAVSALTEVISRLIGLRGEYLLRGLRTLLDAKAGQGAGKLELALGDLFRRKSGAPDTDSDPFATKVMLHPLVWVSADQAEMPANPGNAKLTRKGRQRLPAYLPARTFAAALIDLLVKDASGDSTTVRLKNAIEQLEPGPLKAALTALLDDVAGDIDAFRTRLEAWYDDHMARVSGWYKRHVRWISLGLGVVLVLAFNLSAVAIGQSLYTDQALRDSVVTAATDAADCQGKQPAECLSAVRQQIDSVRGAGLPIGWGPVPECVPHTKCGWLARYGLADPNGGSRFDVMFFLLVLAGWSIMVLALVPGARFWFDILGKLGTLRSTGPKPALSQT
jgi:hypothetical protein